jgi:hypothetical protein
LLKQLNADKNLNIHESFGDKLKDLLNKELSGRSEQITTLEGHLLNDKGSRTGRMTKGYTDYQVYTITSEAVLM